MEHVQVHSEGVRYGCFDGVGVRYCHYGSAPMLASEFVEGGDYAALHLQEGFAFGKTEVTRAALHCLPSREFVERLQAAPSPSSEIAFVQTFVDANLPPCCLTDCRSRLLSPLHRRRIDRCDFVRAGDSRCPSFGLLPALV